MASPARGGGGDALAASLDARCAVAREGQGSSASGWTLATEWMVKPFLEAAFWGGFFPYFLECLGKWGVLPKPPLQSHSMDAASFRSLGLGGSLAKTDEDDSLDDGVIKICGVAFHTVMVGFCTHYARAWRGE